MQTAPARPQPHPYSQPEAEEGPWPMATLDVRAPEASSSQCSRTHLVQTGRQVLGCPTTGLLQPYPSWGLKQRTGIKGQTTQVPELEGGGSLYHVQSRSGHLG